MKKNILLLTTILLCIIFYACKKDLSQSSVSGQPTSADLGITVTTSVSGFVTDENNHAVNGATVTAGSVITTTDSFGFFSIKNATLAKIAGFVKVVYPGYFTAYKTFMCGTSKSLFTRVKLMPKTNTGIINTTTGGSATTTDGATVTLPANGVVVAAGSTTYSGNIHVAAHFIDPTDAEAINLNMPGDLRGVDSTNNIQGLNSYGMLAVELTGDGGQLLQIAAGQHATLSFPIPSVLLASAPATIPLWSFDETNGLWKEEGTATKIGSNYVGNVAHFSYWNCDIPFGAGVVITTQIKDSSLHPFANTGVEIVSQTGDFTGCHGFTDSEGIITGLVPANSNLQLTAMITPCYIGAFSKNFATTSIDANLGILKPARTLQNEYTITGTVVDCNNNPVTDGNVILLTGYGSIYAHVTNGTFSITTITCVNSNFSIVAEDINSLQSGDVQTLSLTPGENNIGALSACGVALGSLTYTLDGVTTTYHDPVDSGYVDVFDYGNSRQADIRVHEFRNGVESMGFIAYSADSVAVVGSNYTFGGLNDYFSYPNSYTLLTIPTSSNFNIPVTITELDNLGGFVSGNFSGQVQNQIDNSLHTVSVQFRLRRPRY